MKIKIKIIEVSHDNLVDLFSTALYGNDRWCVDYDIDTYMKCKNIKQGECLEDKLARLILEGYPIQISDMYCDGEDEYYGKLMHRYDQVNNCMDYDVYLSDIIKGLEEASKNSTSIKYVLDLCDDPAQLDMFDADTLLQYIVFGKQIYG